jgi:multisubunit Na+/H+ antiporter MnhB subunit
VGAFTILVLYVLLGFMIIGSVVAVQTSDLLSAVISVGAVGFALSLIDLFLGAPDLALTQVVVEILVLVFLIRLVVQRRDDTEQHPPSTILVALVMVLFGAILFYMTHALADMIPFGAPLYAHVGRASTLALEYLHEAVSKTGATNVVMAVLLDFRAYDTLGEATVIFTSIVGAYAVLRKVGRIQDEEHAE